MASTTRFNDSGLTINPKVIEKPPRGASWVEKMLSNIYSNYTEKQAPSGFFLVFS